MDLLDLRFGIVSQSLVMSLQVLGVLGLILFRALPSHPWGHRGKILLVLAVVGLGLAGAFHGQERSGTGLFAGATMAFLLIGMITGTASHGTTDHGPVIERIEAPVTA